MNEEIKVVGKNKTWSVVELPPGKEAIGLKWIYKSKFNFDRNLQMHKAQFVANGYAQQPNIKSAFLNRELEEEVYVGQPKGFVIEGMEHIVYKLKKALYGLKQAPRAWYSKIDRSVSEPTLYVRTQGHDDILIESMMQNFEMSDLGLLHYFLGIEVIQNSSGVFICQKKYAMDLLKKFGMENCTPTKTPMNINEKLLLVDEDELANERTFKSMVGDLIYLTHSRPDIMFAMSIVSTILRYIQGTLNFGIKYSKVTNFKLISFIDTNWAGCIDDRKITTGYAFILGSGYIAATATACHTIWLRRILCDLKEKQSSPTCLFCDNNFTIATTKNHVHQGRTKHTTRN
ncbi:hypothetical protein CsSME_00045603 [Camellia sinensis var. sinensis]